MTTPKPAVPVKPGQIWATKDRRDVGKTVRIVELDCRYAVVEVATEATKLRTVRSTVGRRSRVLYDDRGVRGYRLVTDETEAS